MLYGNLSIVLILFLVIKIIIGVLLIIIGVLLFKKKKILGIVFFIYSTLCVIAGVLFGAPWFLLAFPLGIIFFLLCSGGSGLKTRNIRGFAQENVLFKTSDDYYKIIKENMLYELQQRNIPSKVTESKMKSGGIFGSRLPILIIHHPDSSCRYFDIGICVNGNSISFPLLGESAENTKNNKKKIYEREGNYIKANFINPDMFKLQQEHEWQSQVLACFNDNLE